MNNQTKTNDGQLTITSRIIAKEAGETHEYICRVIREMKCSDEFKCANFIESSDTTGRYIDITGDGWVMLWAELSGIRAEKFINSSDMHRNGRVDKEMVGWMNES